MMCRVRAPFALALAAAVPLSVALTSAAMADLPQVKMSAANAVPACVTPGRLTSFLRMRNPRLDERFQTIAADYMRIGNELNIRWDAAFFQMLLETGNLTFTGDVSIDQNNFAGLGATGRKAPGESFKDVQTGVRAHLEHLLLYAGEPLNNPVAERTRKVQEWAVLTSWQKTFTRPMTFGDIAKKWAPTSRGYSRDIEAVSDAFYQGPCKADDPAPDMMALGQPTDSASSDGASSRVETAALAAETMGSVPKISGADLARRANDEARASGSFLRSQLGGASLIESTENTPAATSPAAPIVTILNAAKPEPARSETVPQDAPPISTSEAIAKNKTAAVGQPLSAASPSTAATTVQVAALTSGGALKSAVAKPAPTISKGEPAKPTCRVWTASYGGGRAVIIRAKGDEFDNFTVLDVNEGAEKREADAYIAAYAKGGETVAEFASPSQALDKAFEMCPEG